MIGVFSWTSAGVGHGYRRRKRGTKQIKEEGEELTHKWKREADQWWPALLAATAPIVIFSAATPGQGGQGHVNEQPHEYWISRFESQGMFCDHERSVAFRVSWRSAGVDFWYADNVLVFREEVAASA